MFQPALMVSEEPHMKAFDMPQSYDLQPNAKNRYFDPYIKCWSTKILPGEFHVCNNGEMVVTTLGSCISACIRDTTLGIGGMNHFMLPESSDGNWAGASASTRYGNYAMEHLINEILKRGGKKNRLEAKIFGGGDMMGGSSIQVGNNNIDFAHQYLGIENIQITADDTGGASSRKVYFQPKTGRVMVKKLGVLKNDTINRREASYSEQLKHEPIENDVELF